MAIQAGELEIKIKADLGDLKSDLHNLQGEDIEIDATVNIDDEHLQEILNSTHKITITADDKNATTTANTVAAALDPIKDKNADLTAQDKEASANAETVAAAVDSIAEEKNTTITATGATEAATNITAVDTALDGVVDKTTTITVNGATDAATNITGVVEALGGVTSKDATITASGAAESTASITGVVTALDGVAAKDAEITATGADEAKTAAEGVATALDGIGPKDATITATNDTSEGVTAAQTAINGIDGNVDVTATLSDDSKSLSVDVTANATAAHDSTKAAVEGGASDANATANVDASPAQESVAKAVEEGAKAGAKAVNWSNILGGLKDAVVGIFEFAYNTIKDKVWTPVLESASQYDDYATAALRANMGVDSYQRKAWIAGLLDVEPEEYVMAMRSLYTELNDDWYTTNGKGKKVLKDSAAIEWAKKAGFTEQDITSGKYDQEYIYNHMMSYIANNVDEKQWYSVCESIFGTRRGGLAYSMVSWFEKDRNGKTKWNQIIKEMTGSWFGIATDDKMQGRLSAFKDAYDKVQAILDAFKTSWTAIIAPVFTTVLNNFYKGFYKLGNILKNDKLTAEQKGQQVWDTIKDTLTTTWEQVGTAVADIWKIIEPTFDAIWSKVSSFGKVIGGWFKDIFISAATWINTVLPDWMPKLSLGANYNGKKLNQVIGDRETISRPNGEEVDVEYSVGYIAEYIQEMMGENYWIKGNKKAEEIIRGVINSDKNYSTWGGKLNEIDWTQFFISFASAEYNKWKEENFGKGKGKTTTKTTNNNNTTTTQDKKTTETTPTTDDEKVTPAVEAATAEINAATAAVEAAAANVEAATADVAAAAEALQNPTINVEAEIPVSVTNNITVSGSEHSEVQQYNDTRNFNQQFSGAGRGK